MAMFKINVIFIKPALREIWFQMWRDSAGKGNVSFCEHRNTNICCSSTIKQFKLKINYFNKIFNVYQSDKCANECPLFGTKHRHKPVGVQISLQPPQAGKISWCHDIHPCMWRSYGGTAIQWKMPVWPPISINVYVHYEIFVQLLPVER